MLRRAASFSPPPSPASAAASASSSAAARLLLLLRPRGRPVVDPIPTTTSARRCLGGIPPPLLHRHRGRVRTTTTTASPAVASSSSSYVVPPAPPAAAAPPNRRHRWGGTTADPSSVRRLAGRRGGGSARPYSSRPPPSGGGGGDGGPSPSSSSHPSRSGGSSPLSGLSARGLASLEDRILSALGGGGGGGGGGGKGEGDGEGGGGAVDPVLGVDVRSLGWVRGVSFPPVGAGVAAVGGGEGGAEGGGGAGEVDVPVVSMRLPTLMHPSLPELEGRVRRVTEGVVRSYLAERGDTTNRVLDSVRVEVKSSASRPVPRALIASSDRYDADATSELGPGLSSVSHHIAVYSCKGGVGKSTVAVNLAYELSRMGGRVGLLDCDVYGPSLPVLIRPPDPAVRRSPKGRGMVLPIEHGGVRLMSLGYVSPESGVPGSGPSGGAAVLRGPMASRVLTQLLKGTDWGELDVLVLDLPPGTGDVQLTVCQDLNLSGAVCVTTPSRLAVVDARKGIDMFDKLGVRTVAAVENMSYFDCPGGTRHYPFGAGLPGGGDPPPPSDGAAAENGGVVPPPSLFGPGGGPSLDPSRLFRLPISPHANDANDAGVPLCLSRPGGASDVLSVLADLAASVSSDLLRLQCGRGPSASSGEGAGGDGASRIDTVTFGDGTEEFGLSALRLSADEGGGGTFAVRLFSDGGAHEARISGEKLRRTDPETGEGLAEEDVPPTPGAGAGAGAGAGGMVQRYRAPRLFPARVERRGGYGYSVEWADGATVIYSNAAIAKAAGGTVTRGKAGGGVERRPLLLRVEAERGGAKRHHQWQSAQLESSTRILRSMGQRFLTTE